MRVLPLLLACFLACPASAAPKTYILDSSHVNIDWRVSHFGFSSPSGKFIGVQGKLVLDEAKPEKSSVEMILSPKNVVSGVLKLDQHLQAPEFFDTARYPEARFVSTKVTQTGKDTAKVEGDLTLRGVTKPVTLDVKLNKIGKNMAGVNTAGFSATTVVRRSDFGMTAYLPDLGDEVAITIEAEANERGGKGANAQDKNLNQ